MGLREFYQAEAKKYDQDHQAEARNFLTMLANIGAFMDSLRKNAGITTVDERKAMEPAPSQGMVKTKAMMRRMKNRKAIAGATGASEKGLFGFEPESKTDYEYNQTGPENLPWPLKD